VNPFRQCTWESRGTERFSVRRDHSHQQLDLSFQTCGGIHNTGSRRVTVVLMGKITMLRQAGNGAPSFFVTLSCRASLAWYHTLGETGWPLLVRIHLIAIWDLNCRLYWTNIQLLQEYFQARVEAWLRTVGKRRFDIEHIGSGMSLLLVVVESMLTFYLQGCHVEKLTSIATHIRGVKD
jgi:hypothetical protein